MTAEDRRTRRLRDLPEKWISERDALNIAASKESDEIVRAAWRGQALGRQDCADELAAVLDTEGDRPESGTPCVCGHEKQAHRGRAEMERCWGADDTCNCLHFRIPDPPVQP